MRYTLTIVSLALLALWGGLRAQWMVQTAPPSAPGSTIPPWWERRPDSPNECGEAIPFVDLDHKVMLCTTPKAGSTVLRKLLVRAREGMNASGFPATAGCKQTLLRLSDLDSATRTRVLNDPSFLRIAVVRNPLMRCAHSRPSRVPLRSATATKLRAARTATPKGGCEGLNVLVSAARTRRSRRVVRRHKDRAHGPGASRRYLSAFVMFHNRFGYYRSFASFVDEEARLSTAARSAHAFIARRGLPPSRSAITALFSTHGSVAARGRMTAPVALHARPAYLSVYGLWGRVCAGRRAQRLFGR
jgi:hypothetical protein